MTSERSKLWYYVVTDSLLANYLVDYYDGSAREVLRTEDIETISTEIYPDNISAFVYVENILHRVLREGQIPIVITIEDVCVRDFNEEQSHEVSDLVLLPLNHPHFSNERNQPDSILTITDFFNRDSSTSSGFYARGSNGHRLDYRTNLIPFINLRDYYALLIEQG